MPTMLLRVVTVSAMLLAGPVHQARAQALTVDAPTEAEMARERVERAWSVWQDGDRELEKNLLKLPHERAVERIQRGKQNLDAYLDARYAQTLTLRLAFRRLSKAFEATTVPRAGAETDALVKSAQRDLARLLDDELATMERMRSLKDSTTKTGAGELERESLEKHAADLRQLQEIARKRIELLKLSRETGKRFDNNEKALARTWGAIADALEEQAGSLEGERGVWHRYYDGLLQLVEAHRVSPPDALLDDRKANPS